jgi:hypothetical protein
MVIRCDPRYFDKDLESGLDKEQGESDGRGALSLPFEGEFWLPFLHQVQLVA